MKRKIFWMALGSFITIFVVACFSLLTSYEKNVHKMLGTMVVYKHESITTHLSSDVCGYLHSGSRSLYFGQLPSKDNAIEINSPDRATLYVFPSDQKSIIVRYEPRNGIKRTYKISGFGDFNSLLQALYQLTDNAVFNETVAY